MIGMYGIQHNLNYTVSLKINIFFFNVEKVNSWVVNFCGEFSSYVMKFWNNIFSNNI